MHVFVTVGSTSFDDLIKDVCSSAVLKTLLVLGYRSVTLQIGNGCWKPEPEKSEVIKIDWYSFKPSLDADMKAADLIISHAGAGCILESLRLQKKLLVVVNEALMDNHQYELAKKLESLGHLLCCNCQTLNSTLTQLPDTSFTVFEPGTPQLLADYLLKNFFSLKS